MKTSTAIDGTEREHRDAHENAPHARKPRNCTRIEYSHGVSRHRLRPSADTHGNHTIPKQGIARSRPARDSTSSGQTVDKREIPEHPQREHPPTRRDNHANTVQTRKREKPTPRPPEQRRGKPQQAGAWTPADSRGIEPHPNNSSEPISSRTLHLAGLLSK